MPMLSVTRIVQPLIIALAALAITPVLSSAATVPVKGTVLHAPALSAGLVRPSGPASAAGKSWHPRRVGPHVFFGTITAINGSGIIMQLRNGHMLNVEATAAIANGDFSAPLFVGKIVSVDGDEAGGVFTAEHIFRLSNLEDLRADK